MQAVAAMRALLVVEVQIPLELPLKLRRLREVRPTEDDPPVLREDRALQALHEERINPRPVG